MIRKTIYSPGRILTGGATGGPMLGEMTRKGHQAEPPTPSPTRADGRPKSLLSIEGERASLAARRTLLLKTLEQHEWNLTATAEALHLTNASTVIRAIRDLGLDAEYEGARSAGKIRPGHRGDQ